MSTSSSYDLLFKIISSTIKKWVDVDNNMLPEGDKNFDFIDHDIVDGWVIQTMRLYDAVTAKRAWNNAKYTHFENIWEELKTRREQMLELNKISLRLSFGSKSPEVTFFNTLSLQKVRLTRSLNKDYLDVAKLLGVPGLEDTWKWVAQYPERLTVTQFKRLPKH